MYKADKYGQMLKVSQMLGAKKLKAGRKDEKRRLSKMSRRE